MMREFDFISKLAGFSPKAPIGIGDDGACLGEYIIVKDIMAEAVHFERSWGIDTIINRLFISNISDLCAMGAKAGGYKALLAVAIPNDLDRQALVAAIEHAVAEYEVQLIGGDTVVSSGGLFLSLTLIGRRGKNLLLRSKCQAGDLICLSRPIGGAALELAKRLKGEEGIDFPPEQSLGEFLGEYEGAGAAVDISDGLGRDIAHMAEASGVCILLEAERIPLAKGAELPSALASGEEYALAFSLRPDSCIPQGSTVIGYAEKGEGAFLFDKNKRFNIESFGYEH